MRVPEPLRGQAVAVRDGAYARALASPDRPLTTEEVGDKVADIVRGNFQGGTRLPLSCSLAAATDPTFDIHNAFIGIGHRAFHGRAFDEDLVRELIESQRLPTMPSTAFTSRGLARGNAPLSLEHQSKTYHPTIELFDRVAAGELSADDLLAETLRALLAVKREQEARMAELTREVASARSVPTHAEILDLVRDHHLAEHASRLPVLALAAAYTSAGPEAGWTVRALHGHFAADKQTGALGDIEVVSTADGSLVNVLDGKDKPVSPADLYDAARKAREGRVPAYIIATTDWVSKETKQAAADLSGDSEIAVRHWLDLLEDILLLYPCARGRFVPEYLRLVSDDHQVGQPLQESLLSLVAARLTGRAAA